MKLNRRSVLGAIGMIGVGTGAAFGSGAFTTVEAERAVEVNVIGGNFVADGVLHLTDNPGGSELADETAVDIKGNDITDANGNSQTVSDVEEQVFTEILGSDNTADVLVNTESDFITLKAPNSGNGEGEIDGRSLYPVLSGTYGDSGTNPAINENYVSLVANDVRIVFGPDGRKLPPNSALDETDLFGVVKNGSVDITFLKNDTDNRLLTSVGGTNLTSNEATSSTSDSGNTTLSGRVQTGEESRETEDLIIQIGNDSQ